MTRKENVRITILQIDTVWGDPAANIGAAERMMTAAPASDVYVLPEMWATGFDTSDPAAAFTNEPLAWMADAARRRGCAVCGGVIAQCADGAYRNRHCFVRPDGRITYYDKRHLFTYGGEDKTYVPGTQRVVAEYGGVRFLLQACYDLRFPVWMRNRNDYDAVLIVANWPESRRGAWHVLLRARAIENQCYVIAANRAGTDPSCRYMGDSAVIDAKGRTVAQAAAGGMAQYVSAELDMDALERFRSKFPVLNDIDDFELRL